MFDTNTVDTIINFVDQEITKYSIPYKKGNSILIGSYAIRHSKDNYLIFNCKDNSMIEKTYSRVAAIAIAKYMNMGIDIRQKVRRLDETLQKHYTDAIFYKNIIKTTTSDTRRAVQEARLQVALEKTQNAYYDLEQFVLSDHK